MPLRDVADAIDAAVRVSRRVIFTRRPLGGSERAELEGLMRQLGHRSRTARKAPAFTINVQLQPGDDPHEIRRKTGLAIAKMLVPTAGTIVLDRDYAVELAPFAGFEVDASEQETAAIRTALLPYAKVMDAYRRAAANLKKSALGKVPGVAEAVGPINQLLPRIAPGRPKDPFSLSSELARRLTRLGIRPKEREVLLLYASLRAVTTQEKPPQ